MRITSISNQLNFKGLIVIGKSGDEDNSISINTTSIHSIVPKTIKTATESTTKGTEIIFGPNAAISGLMNAFTCTVIKAPPSEVIKAYQEAEKNGISYLPQAKIITSSFALSKEYTGHSLPDAGVLVTK